MFDHILKRMRDQIDSLHYVMTLHAEEEMNNDRLTIYDVEPCILTGTIVECQTDALADNWKYRVHGQAVDGSAMEVVAKLAASGTLVIITVYIV